MNPELLAPNRRRNMLCQHVSSYLSLGRAGGHAPLPAEELEELDEPELPDEEDATTAVPTTAGREASCRQQLRQTAA